MHIAEDNLWYLPEGFIEKTENDPYLLYADTDSVRGDTLISINGKSIKIEDFYEFQGNIIKESNDNFIKCFNDHYLTPSININFKLEDKKIIYCMKHKVQKKFFKLKIRDKEVVITEDHSLVVYRNGKLKTIKPNEILQNDKLFKLQ